MCNETVRNQCKFVVYTWTWILLNCVFAFLIAYYVSKMNLHSIKPTRNIECNRFLILDMTIIATWIPFNSFSRWTEIITLVYLHSFMSFIFHVCERIFVSIWLFEYIFVWCTRKHTNITLCCYETSNSIGIDIYRTQYIIGNSKTALLSTGYILTSSQVKLRDQT